MKDNSNRVPRQADNAPAGTVGAQGGALEREIDRERIERRAYEIYESRDREDGRADEDWFQAESEYAARNEDEANGVETDDASSSFGDRVRNARR